MTRRGPLPRRSLALCAALLLLAGSAASARPFSPGNLLVTHGSQLREYTPEGVLVQALPVPSGVFGAIADVEVDRFGRAHVLHVDGLIDTYDPFSETWTHIRVESVFGNLSDGDIALLGDYAFTRRERIHFFSGEADPLFQGGGIGEVSVGLDGLLYVLDSGSPRPDVRVLDPEPPHALIRMLTLRDTQGFRLDARGIAVASDGTLYVADSGGSIHVYDAAGTLQEVFPVMAGTPLDIDLSPEGVLVGGTRFGKVFVTDASFTGLRIFSAGPNSTYATYVPVARERPDRDADAILDLIDNCPDAANRDQENGDTDDLGDACDPFPDDSQNLGRCFSATASCEEAIDAVGTRIVQLEQERAGLELEHERLTARARALEAGNLRLRQALDQCMDSP